MLYSYKNSNQNSPFDPKLDELICMLYEKKEYNKGNKILKELKKLINNGNADASFIYGRCFCGPCFIDPGFHFEENDDMVDYYVKKAILEGSAIAMLGSRRIGGFTPPDNKYVHFPYESDEQLWNMFYQYAMSGHSFCKFVIANSIYWGDIFTIFNMELGTLEDYQRYYSFLQMADEMFRYCYPLGYNCAGNFKGNKEKMDEIHQIITRNSQDNVVIHQNDSCLKYKTYNCEF